ncbi:MAG: S8 family serine peptidase [candidate division Zixibacteria bacterium]|nr:S8 family serine peptidase [candidate division Zixibacteria bacterium]
MEVIMYLSLRKTTIILLGLLFAFSASAVYAEVLTSAEGYQYFSDRMIVCTTKDSPKLNTGELATAGFTTGVQSIDNLCAQYGVERVEPYYKGKLKRAVHLKELMSRTYVFFINETKSVHEARVAFSADTNVEHTDLWDIPVPFYTPNDPRLNQQWFLGQINAYDAWDIIRGQQSEFGIIGISDTGVYYEHPDLEPNMWINGPEDINGNGTYEPYDESSGGDWNYEDDDDNGYEDDVVGFDFGWGDPDPKEDSPTHGTHVAGCASEATDNDEGGAGIGFSGKIIAAKGARNGQLTAVYAAIIYSAENGAHVCNCSWGSNYYSNTNQQIIRNSFLDGCLVIAAAGNDGVSTRHYPAAYDSCLSVAATTRNDVRASFTNYGDWVDISAPGVDIYSTWATGSYQSLQGTSMASPVVSGVASLVISQNHLRTPQQIWDILKSSADSLSLYNANPNYIGQLGTGRVDAYAALAAGTMPNIQYVEMDISILNDDGDGILNPGENIEMVITLQNIWADATNVQGTLTGPSYMTVTDGEATFGNIPSGGEADNSADPFDVEIALDAPVEIADMNLHITAEGDYEVDLTIPLEIALNQLNFPMSVDGNIEGSFGFDDFDGNGVEEIVFGTSDDEVHIIDSDGTELPGWPVVVDGDVVGGVAIGQVDYAGTRDVVVATKTGNIYAINSLGSVFQGFPVNAGQSYYSTPTLADINGDNTHEIICTAFGDGKLYVLKSDGSDLDGFPVETGNRFYGSAAVGDIDNDGSPEIIAGVLDGNLQAWNHDGTVVSGFPVNLQDAIWVAPALGDIDNDGDLEIAIGTQGGNLYAVHHDGSIVSGFPAALSGTIKSDPSVAQVVGDDGLEIFVGTNDHFLYGVKGDGSIMTGFPVDCNNSITSSPSIADLDGDGENEVFVSATDGVIYGFNPDGSAVRNFPVPTYGTLTNSSVAIGNFDGDGDLELAVGLRQSFDNVFVVDYKETASFSGSDWRMFGHDITRTHRWHEWQTDIDDEGPDALPKAFELSQNYPNPFNPSTKIMYSLPSDSKVKMVVYNLMGREVATLVDKHQKAGSHEVAWDGRNAGGQKVASGIYFYKLDTDDQSAVKKMLLMK